MSIRVRLQERLTTALKTRDRAAASVYRTALSAIANAEAVPVDTMPPAGAIELAALGVGAGDAPRRHLTEAEQRGIVAAEVAELIAAAAQLSPGRAEPLLQSASLLEAALAG